MENDYKTLGLDKGASLRDVKKAYRKKALELHPDKNPEESATSKFLEIKKAYDAICGKEDEGNNSHSSQTTKPPSSTSSKSPLSKETHHVIYKPNLVAIKKGIKHEEMQVFFLGKEDSGASTLGKKFSFEDKECNLFSLWTDNPHVHFNCHVTSFDSRRFNYFKRTVSYLSRKSQSPDAIFIMASSQEDMTDGMAAVQNISNDYEYYGIEYAEHGIKLNPIQNFSDFNPVFIGSFFRANDHDMMVSQMAGEILKIPEVVIIESENLLQNVIISSKKNYKAIFKNIREKYIEFLENHYASKMDDSSMKMLKNYMIFFMNSILWPAIDKREELLRSLVKSYSKYPSLSWLEDKNTLSEKIDVLTSFLINLKKSLFKIFDADYNGSLKEIIATIIEPTALFAQENSQEIISENIYCEYRAKHNFHGRDRFYGKQQELSQPIIIKPIEHSSKTRHWMRDFFTRNLMGHILILAATVFSAPYFAVAIAIDFCRSCTNINKEQPPISLVKRHINSYMEPINRAFFKPRTESILLNSRDKALSLSLNNF